MMMMMMMWVFTSCIMTDVNVSEKNTVFISRDEMAIPLSIALQDGKALEELASTCQSTQRQNQEKNIIDMTCVDN
jgi:hypothetical protein